jgi:hypothetical protein
MISSFLQTFFDPLVRTDRQAADEYRLAGDALSWAVPIGIGLALLVLSAVALVVEDLRAQFFFSYHVAWTFCLSIALGALIFVIIQHLSRAEWSPVVRRIAEVLAWSFPMLAVLSVPMWFGMHDLFHWTHAELYDPGSFHYDPILAGKRGYLNVPFFVIRFVVFFGAWTLISYKLFRLSVEQDVDPDASIPGRQRTVSAWGLAVFALTTAFASYDYLMSLDPHWFSTIFGVYFFAGGILGAFCVMTLAAMDLRRRGVLTEAITKEHYHDLGKFIFGFIVFWAYIAFSQYMLIWYANIPEETAWYLHRSEHGWEALSVALILGHFVVPFLILLPRGTKRTLPILGTMAAWMLIMHAFDMYWVVMPALHGHWTGFHWLDVTCLLGLAALFWGMYVYRLNRHSTVPYNDPRFEKSLAFENQ